MRIGLVAAGYVLALACLAVSNPAHAVTEWNYDPTKCKTDAHDKLYIGLGRYVFAVPGTTVPFVGEIYPHMGIEPIPAPDPSEQEGCPLNPRQLQSYAFGYAHLQTDNSSPGKIINVQPGALLVQLIRTVKSSAVPSSERPEWIGERGEIELSQKVCATATRQDRLPNGITACLRKQGEREVLVEDWRGSYISSPEVYGTPLGKPFTVNCADMSYSFGGQCDVAYSMKAGLGVTYRFAIQKGTTIQIDDVLDFDRGIRALIEDMSIKDYAWPDSSSEYPDSRKGEQQ